jgi:hypothetical protein
MPQAGQRGDPNSDLVLVVVLDLLAVKKTEG